jgi:hypothetical protein
MIAKAQRDTISFDLPKLARFKKALAESTDEIFEFEGHQFVKGYAKYLVQYAESRLSKGAQPGKKGA